jgi:hypothetical protein
MNTRSPHFDDDSYETNLTHRHGHFRRNLLILLSLAFALFISLFNAPSNVANAQNPNPPNQPARGLVYDGLVKSTRADCPNGYLVRTPISKRPLCTHGPDPIPLGATAEASVAPLAENLAAAQVVCDGDGQSGKRIQVMYVRAADQPDRYDQYLNSIQQWAAGADQIYNLSAAETGGERHLRFVHDANCMPVVENVVLSPTGDDNIVNTTTELMNLGFRRGDRNYLLFVDASVYCGIATMYADDSPFSNNLNNSGSNYARVDARCWGAWTAAHETMHTLGGVQLTAPHTTGAWHCYDESDVMCYKDSSTAPAMQYICDSSHESRFDCDHDDYFNTNPTPGSYLSTHWNSAQSDFLIIPTQWMGVDSIVSGTQNKRGKFTAADTFKRGDTMVIQTHVKNGDGSNTYYAQVTMTVNAPDNSVMCTAQLVTDETGSGQFSCTIPRKAATGIWTIQVANMDKPGYTPDPSAMTVHAFTVTAH